MKKIIFTILALLAINNVNATIIEIEITEKTLENENKMIEFFEIMGLMDEVNGKILNNKLSYDDDKYKNITNKATKLQKNNPIISTNEPKYLDEYIVIGGYFLYVEKNENKKIYKLRLVKLSAKEIPDIVLMKDFSLLGREQDRVRYAFEIYALQQIGKNTELDQISLNKYDKDKLVTIHNNAIETYGDLKKYILCEDDKYENIILKIQFRNKIYKVLESKMCEI